MDTSTRKVSMKTTELKQAKVYLAPTTQKYKVLSEQHKIVYVYLYKKVNTQEQYYTESQADIASSCELDIRVVRKIISEFIEDGVLVAEKVKPLKGAARWFYIEVHDLVLM